MDYCNLILNRIPDIRIKFNDPISNNCKLTCKHK